MSMDVRQGVILFADVVGSTSLFDQFGDRTAAEQINSCLSSLSGITNNLGGAVIKTIGDAVLCEFESPDDAMRAAYQMQEATKTMITPAGEALSIRVGAHFGRYMHTDDDIAGDAVNIAARLSGIAGSKRIIISEDLIEHLNANEKSKTRPYDRVVLKGKSDESIIYEYLWELTDVTTISIPVPSASSSIHQLILEYGGEQFRAYPDTKNFVIGRHSRCDITVNSHMSSRFHARIEYHRGKFLIVDESTNGTFVLSNNEEVYIRRESLPLVGSGVISLGESTTSPNSQVISYNIQQS